MLLIARHGETEWNAAGRIQGRGDSALTARGRDQARRLAAFVADQGVERLFASPLGRARETAAIVARALDLEPVIDERLVEGSAGVGDGLTFAEIETRHAGALARRDADRWRVALPRGETVADIWDRVESFAREYFGVGGHLDGGDADRVDGHRALVIAHQGVNRVLLGIIMGFPPADILRLAQPNDVIFRCTNDGVAGYRLDG